MAVRIHCFPSVDVAFAREVEALLHAARSSWGSALQPEVLRTALQARYPNVVVSAQEQLARRGDENTFLWYVFRDGGLASRMRNPRRVLVVDDDDAFAEMLEAMLLDAGFLVRRARDGAEGLTMAGEFAPNLILLDLAMPRSTGEEFSDRYHKVRDGRAQIVVLSGVPDAWKRAQRTEARAVVRKPFEMDAFLTLVRHLA